MKVCIVGISGKLGQYMTQHALDRGYEVVGVCREQSVHKLDRFGDRITVRPGATDDREVIRRAVAGCDGVLVVLAPWGMHGYATGTAQAVLDYAEPGARLVFSCGWHITRDGQDHYSWPFRAKVWVLGSAFRLSRATSPTRSRRPGASSPSTPAGRWCAAATSEKATVRACRSGAATSATPSWPATGPAASTSRCSWLTRSRATSWSTRHRRLWAARRRRRSPMSVAALRGRRRLRAESRLLQAAEDRSWR